jgi:L-gulonolactone oxidase
VAIELAPIHSAYLRTERIAFRNIDEFFRLSAESSDAFEHTVSWIDCANVGSFTGRGVFQRSNWLSDGRLYPHERRSGPTLPVDFPDFAINPASVRLFNLLYRRLQLRGPLTRNEHYRQSFYPLDAIREWNRIYGSAGLYQYQCVVPPGQEKAVAEMIETIARSGRGSFLVVLKTFGSRQSPGLVSYPMEGSNLAIDFANRGQRTLEVLAKLDEIVLKAGGRLYPAKDGRMPARMFQTGYPRWRQLRALKDPGIESDFWRRVSLE